MSDEVRDFYNRYGEREWHRLDADANSRITFILHPTSFMCDTAVAF
jgi:hypothetical protein